MKKIIGKIIDLDYEKVGTTTCVADTLRDGTLRDAIDVLTRLSETFGEDARLDITSDDSHSFIDIQLFYQREETDQEYAERLQKEKLEQEELTRKAKLREDTEYQTYLELKAKFGGV